MLDEWNRNLPARKAMVEAAIRYYKLLDQGITDEEAKRELDLLSIPFSEDPAFAGWRAFLEMKRVFAMSGKRWYPEFPEYKAEK